VKLSTKNIVAWVTENERHISTVIFVGGFIADLIGYANATITLAEWLFAVYLAIILVGLLGAHYTHLRDYQHARSLLARIVNIALPLITDFFIGALLSGLLIFYTKGSSVLVSWPFILILFAVFFGNELFREYKRHFAFHLVLVFFCIYAYAIFALPVALGAISTRIFIESGLAALGVFIVFLSIVGVTNWKRLRESAVWTFMACALLLIVVNLSYVTGIIPPLPLTLSDVGVYHSVQRTDAPTTTYTLVGEPKRAWWKIFQPEVVHLTPGSPLYVYSAVFAPVAFSSTIEHKWEQYDAVTKTWKSRGVVAFLVSGGRATGYRGYSMVSAVTPGLYRITIQTLSGQIIGREHVQVVEVAQEPALQTVTK
jgi:hypothetical protein